MEETVTLKETITAHALEMEGEYFVRHVYYIREDECRRTTFYTVANKVQAAILVQAINSR